MKTIINEPITAKYEFFLISSAIVGPTLIEDIIPTVLTAEPLMNSSIVKLLGRKFDKEEKIVNTLTNGLMNVFVDNPWLMEYIKEQIDKEYGKSSSQTE